MGKVIKLKKPVTVKGKPVTEVNLDFEKLTGNDMIQAEKVARAMGVGEASVLASMKYQTIIAAKAIGCPVDDLFELGAVDFKNIAKETTNFLLG